MIPRAFLFACLALAGVIPSPGEERPTVRLEPGERTGQLYLEGEAARTHFDGRGVVIRSGRSEHISPPPTFALYHSARHDPRSGIGYPSTSDLERLVLVGSSRVDLQACKLEYSIVSPK